jgi:acyl dehydratase
VSWQAGEVAAFRRVLLQEDFDRFARLTGDDNPIHCDPAFAARSHFGATVCHGMLLYGCIAKALAELIPGPGAVQLEQELMFPHPLFVGEEITVSLRVERVNADGTLELGTTVTKPGSAAAVIAAQGRSRVVPPGGTGHAPAPSVLPPEAGDDELYGLRPGMAAGTTRTFGASDLAEYGDLVGDRNPIHRDDAWARRRGLPGRVVPCPLLAGMFSDLLGTRLPGRGTGWMKQKLAFLSPACPGEALTARVAIARLRRDKELVNLRSTITAGDGRLVCDGESLVLVRNLESKLGAR